MRPFNQALRFIGFVVNIAAWGIGLGLPGMAMADGYPTKPITVVAVSPPGGGDDFTARLFAQQLRESTKQTVMVENIAGGGATIAYTNVARSAPDGHRLLISNSVQTSFPALYTNLPFDPVEGFEHIGLIFKTPFAVTVSNRLNVKNLAEFIQLAKASPGKLNFGSGGSGTGNHLAGEIFKNITGTDIVHVPFKGAGPVMVALLGGQIDVMFATLTTGGLAGHHASGGVRILAISDDRRALSLPSIPTAAEAGLPGYMTSIWWAVSAPKGVPADVVERLNREIKQMVKSPAVIQRFNDMGAIPLGTSAAEAKELIVRETKSMSAFVTSLGLKP